MAVNNLQQILWPRNLTIPSLRYKDALKRYSKRLKT